MRINADPELCHPPNDRSGLALSLAIATNGIVASFYLATIASAPVGSELDLRSGACFLLIVTVVDAVIVFPICLVSLLRRPRAKTLIATLLALPPIFLPGLVARLFIEVRQLTIDT